MHMYNIRNKTVCPFIRLLAWESRERAMQKKWEENNRTHTIVERIHFFRKRTTLYINHNFVTPKKVFL